MYIVNLYLLRNVSTLSRCLTRMYLIIIKSILAFIHAKMTTTQELYIFRTSWKLFFGTTCEVIHFTGWNVQQHTSVLPAVKGLTLDIWQLSFHTMDGINVKSNLWTLSDVMSVETFVWKAESTVMKDIPWGNTWCRKFRNQSLFEAFVSVLIFGHIRFLMNVNFTID